MDKENFLHPSDDCRGTDFWMLNDALNDEELVNQLEKMHEQGIASVIARTYIGLRSDYPGKDFMHKMRITVDTAKRLGMTVFMQAGYMPEAVLGLPPEYVLGNLRVFPKGSTDGVLFCTHGDFEYRLVPSENILDMLSPDACKYYVMQSYENMWKDFKEDFGKTIVSVWVDEPSYAHVSLPWTGGFADAYESIWNEKFPFDSVFLLFENGDGAEKVRYRYWRTVLHLITSSYFQSVKDWCDKNGVMFSGHLMMEDTLESQIRATCFTMPCYKYFDMPGIDNLETALDWQYGAVKPKREDDMYWRHYGIYNTPLQCVSASHQAGKNRILCEMYGVSTENLNLRDQKHIFDHFASFGINHRSVHGIFYSLRGRGKRAYPPHINYYQPYFEKYRVLTDTIARESAFLRSGKPVRDIMLLHPMDSAFCMYQAPGADKNFNSRLREYEVYFNGTVRALTAAQENFELGDEDSIAIMGSADKDGFKIGRMKYRTVILPYCMNLRKSTLELLEKYILLGGKVIVFGRYPSYIDGEKCDISERLKGSEFVSSLSELLSRLESLPSRYRYFADDDGTQTKIYYTEDGVCRNFFILNGDCREERSGRIRVEGSFTAEAYNPQTGEIKSYPTNVSGDYTEVEIRLLGGESIMLVMTPSFGTLQSRTVASHARIYLELPTRWRAKRNNDNSLLLEMFRFAKGSEEMSEKSYPILAIQEILEGEDYHGEITLECSFESRISISGARLVTENPELQTILLDGEKISSVPAGFYLDKAFETLTLPEITVGKHTVTIKRFFETPKKAKMAVTSLFENLPGTKLEQLMILGDFSVGSSREQTVSHVIRVGSEFVLEKETSRDGLEWSSKGYPFYAGTFDIETEFELSEELANGNPVLHLDAVFAAAGDVFLNGSFVGTLAMLPYEVKLEGAVKGKNTVTIRLYSTLRNTLGPWHRPCGEIGAAWGGYSRPDLPWLGAEKAEGVLDEKWYEHRVPDTSGWTESYLVLPFGIKGARIISDID